MVAGDSANGFVATMRRGAALLEAGKTDSARAELLRAQALFPEYAGPSAPSEYLARIARDGGDLRGALDAITRVTRVNERAWDANLMEADLRERLGDSTGAMAPLERLIWISPYDVAVHVHLAELAGRAGRHAVAIRERRAALALDPPDPLEARYQLARALAASGDAAGARREVLAVLERAPSFEKGQALLLELRGAAGGARP
jgi:tetratricopeptide (TPR) repeat protein